MTRDRMARALKRLRRRLRVRREDAVVLVIAAHAAQAREHRWVQLLHEWKAAHAPHEQG